MINPRLEEILRKVREIEELPTYEEAIELFEICARSSIFELVNTSRIFPRNVFPVLNVQFVDALAEDIKRETAGNIVEIGAGNGKLAYHLRLRHIPVIATDDYSMLMPRDETLVKNMRYILLLIPLYLFTRQATVYQITD